MDFHGFQRSRAAAGKPVGCQIWDGFRDLEIEMEVEGGDGVYPPQLPLASSMVGLVLSSTVSGREEKGLLEKDQ